MDLENTAKVKKSCIIESTTFMLNNRKELINK